MRDALTVMWGCTYAPKGFVRTKLATRRRSSVSASPSSSPSVGRRSAAGRGGRTVLAFLNLDEVAAVDAGLRVLSVVLSLVATWVVFIWVIARLPRGPVTFRNATTAALFAAIVFEIFKQVGAIYLQVVTRGSAGVAFGPIIGVLVFTYLASRMLLFATAWAATQAESVV
nr:YhjD/YihY/BrkB family envelope integrity protein [Rhodococcus sp. 3A]